MWLHSKKLEDAGQCSPLAPRLASSCPQALPVSPQPCSSCHQDPLLGSDLLPRSCLQQGAKGESRELKGREELFRLGKFCCCFWPSACWQKLEASPHPVITGGAPNSALSWSYTVRSLYYSVLFYYSVWFGSCLRNLRLLKLYILRSLKSVDRNSFQVSRPESTLLILELQPIGLAGQLWCIHTAPAGAFPLGHNQPNSGHRPRRGPAMYTVPELVTEKRGKQDSCWGIKSKNPICCITPFCWDEAWCEPAGPLWAVCNLLPISIRAGGILALSPVGAAPLQGSEETSHLVFLGPWISSLQGKDSWIVSCSGLISSCTLISDYSASSQPFLDQNQDPASPFWLQTVSVLPP